MPFALRHLPLLFLFPACGDKGDPGPEADADTDADTDTDADADADTDTDTDTDTDSDADTDSDTDTLANVYDIGDLPHTKILGTLEDSSLGNYGEELADLSGDGIADLVAGPAAPNDVWGFMAGPFTAGSVDIDLDAWASEFETTWMVPLGDLNGDAIDDMVNHDGVYHGPLSGELAPEDAIPIYNSNGANTGRLGIQPGALGDLNGDGFGDLLACWGASGGSGGSPGAAYLLNGPATTPPSYDTPWAEWTAETNDSGLQTGTGPGDVDGDGLADALVTSEDFVGPEGSYGAIYLISGALSGTRSLADAEARFTTTPATGDYAYFVVTPIGDVDGDGLDDILASDYGPYYYGNGSGAGWIFTGAPSSFLTIDDADITLLATVEAARIGNDVAADDFDGDGARDVAISRYTSWSESATPADAVVVFGPFPPGVYEVDEEGVGIVLSTSQLSTPTHLATGGDVDGDGLPDLLLTDRDDDTNAEDAGAVYLLFGSSLAAVKP